MTTRREQVLVAIVSALQAGSTPVYRSRVEPLARNESPAIIVEPTGDVATQTTIGRLDWTLGVKVLVIVRGDVPDQIADPIIQDVHARIMADLSLGGISYDLQPQSVTYEMVDADQPAGVVTMEFNVLYKTNLQNMATL